MPIISRSVFESIDKNKDGFVSKGELRMAAKDMSLKELVDIINEVIAAAFIRVRTVFSFIINPYHVKIDKDSDGKLNFEEVKAISKRAYSKKKGPPRKKK